MIGVVIKRKEMGELSKKIGEQGEKLVIKFLSILGWGDFQEGESINCRYSKEHQRKKDSPRQTHGIDVFHSTRSQLQDFTLDNIVISAKYTAAPYPVNPVSIFKRCQTFIPDLISKALFTTLLKRAAITSGSIIAKAIVNKGTSIHQDINYMTPKY